MPIKNILVTLYWAMVHSLGTTGLVSNATLSDDRLVVLVGPPFVATIFVLLEPLNGFDVVERQLMAIPHLVACLR